MEENNMQTYLTKNLKTYVPDKEFKHVNGLDMFVKSEVDIKVEATENLIKEMNEKNRKMNRTLYHWNEMIDILQKISVDIKETERGNVTFVPMFPANHFKL